jgi:hypothetical protein
MGLFPGSLSYQQCEGDNARVADNGVKPVCGKGGAGGKACTDCTGALSAAGVTDGDALTQSWYDCGQNGGNALVTTKPHCYVNGVPTGQPPTVCYGNFIPDGNGGATLAATG